MSFATPAATTTRGREGLGLYLRRWLANPLQMGAVLPSSSTLCRRIVEQVRLAPDEIVLELGAGTGVVTRAMLGAGIPASRIVALEIVPEMADHLATMLPPEQVLCGDAFRLAEILPRQWHGRVGTVICGIPLVMLPREQQGRIIDGIEAVAPGRGFLHYTFCITSPLPWRALGLTARREAWTPRNLPPASVWRYAPAHRRVP
jgi:phosphatidylethanolamine/phosphatidyl-N-methylethanolamine N-methyltransferase